MAPLLGCIADDFTGATDLANTLVRGGMRTIQTIGVPGPGWDGGEADALVVALKSRTIPAAEAVAQSLAALAWLRARGTEQHFFKYCSTFDSTDQGNIGPVADALLDALGARLTILCPAFPTNGRTVYLGHLFVGETLLSDSPMRHHPLTPMTDANLVRVLARQTPRPVGLVAHATVRQGAAAIEAELGRLADRGVAHAVVDALTDEDLLAIGRAVRALPLVTGGSGVALGLPANFVRAGRLATGGVADALPRVDGRAAVIAGSCSEATRRQVAVMAKRHPTIALDPLATPDPSALAERALGEAAPHLAAERPVLVSSSAAPEHVAAVQAALGREGASRILEEAMARVAAGLVARGVRRLIVAGGETAGAVVQALGVTALRIGPQIDPGVPWTVGLGGHAPIALALKSGNFGQPDFFLRALAALDGGEPS
jgi:uncharacterized protein YgbK (DUF1537 family)